MKLANLDGRATILAEGGGIDLERASGGRFGPDVQALYDDWDEVRELAAGLGAAEVTPFDETRLGSPVPAPRQVFAIGLNYRSHAEESGMDVPAVPATFTKFPASLAGPFDDVELAGATVDWEVELVAVIGARADRVAEADGWSHVAGLTRRPGHLGADRPVRGRQPVLAGQVVPRLRADGPVVGHPRRAAPIPTTSRSAARSTATPSRTPAPATSSSACRASSPSCPRSCPLLPGDVIFTGTPAGVGITSQAAAVPAGR